MRKIFILFIILLYLIAFSSHILAVEAGGEVELLLSGIWLDSGGFESEIKESIDLEFYLPEIKGNEIHYAFQLDKPLQDLWGEEDAVYFTKKLYLRHKFERFNLTIGRQPVSWSFGSMFNPVDYTLGAVALDKESKGKYTDALEAYIPINWNSGLSIVSSYPDGFSDNREEMKWGMRGRMGVKGYDLTLNYVHEAETDISPIPAERFGLTLKGDLGEMGVYAAYGHYFSQDIENGNSYLLGMDYSHKIDYFTKVNIQLEYLNLDNINISSLFGPYFMINSVKQKLDLLSASFTYPVDDFSSINLTAVTKLDDNSLIIIPTYESTLAANIDLTLSGQFFPSEDMKVVSVGFSYPF